MKSVRAYSLTFACAALAGLLGANGYAQSAGTPMSDAAAQARELGAAGNIALRPMTTNEAAANQVPLYAGNTTPESAHFSRDDDSALTSATARSVLTNEGFLAAQESDRRRARFAPAEFDALKVRSVGVRENANAFAQGIGGDGSKGNCVELPPSVEAKNFYEATCNIGLDVSQGGRSCPVTLKHNFSTSHRYTCTRVRERGQICLQGTFPNCPEPDFVDEVLGSGCDALEANPICSVSLVRTTVVRRGTDRRAQIFYEEYAASCSAAATGSVSGGGAAGNDGTSYNPLFTDLGIVQTYLSSEQDASQCQALSTDAECNTPVDVCTDSEPATRVINGTAVTQPCWAWNRTYQCTGTTPAQNCSEIEAKPGCSFLREECLDDPQVGACIQRERIYRCPSPDQTPATKQFICSGDLYCADGQCETLEREANDEFKDALVGLHALGQAGVEFDESNFTLFKGLAETCSKPVFGLANCCGGNGIPLIGVCSAQEKLLDKKIDKGLCHYIGAYCGKSILGICTSKRKSYCCYQSKLTRIIQEGGRPQLGLTFGSPKRPICDGFTIDQFSQLDLSQIDFSEIYNELLDAVKLPDEAQTLIDIQTKIRDFYARNGG